MGVDEFSPRRPVGGAPPWSQMLRRMPPPPLLTSRCGCGSPAPAPPRPQPPPPAASPATEPAPAEPTAAKRDVIHDRLLAGVPKNIGGTGDAAEAKPADE